MKGALDFVLINVIARYLITQKVNNNQFIKGAIFLVYKQRGCNLKKTKISLKIQNTQRKILLQL